MMDRLIARTLFVPTLVWNLLLVRLIPARRWWDHVDPQVILGALPFTAHVSRLHKSGVRAVVNTCDEYAGPIAEYTQVGIEQFHMPTPDFTHPDLADVERAVEFVQSHAEQGHTVYIHCKAGRARSATVALCWLVRHRGLSPEEAQEKLLQERPHVKRTVWQRPVVTAFADRCRQETSAATD